MGQSFRIICFFNSNHVCSTCRAILQGHTSLVGQLQMRGSTLVTGGSDGSVRVWSLDTHSPIHRLAAHDNSVTSLQFDDTRIVSGGSDGRVKIWDLNAGTLTRELSQPAEAVWRVAFEEERSVVLASRQGRTVMEVWDFSPPDEDGGPWSRPLGGPSISRPIEHPIGGMVEDAVMEDIVPTVAEGNSGTTMGDGRGRREPRRAKRKSKESLSVQNAQARIESENGTQVGSHSHDSGEKPIQEDSVIMQDTD